MSRESDNDEPKRVVTPGFASKTHIIEQVDNGSFLVFDRREQKFIIGKEAWYVFTLEGIECIPLARLPWKTAHLPKDEEPERLYDEIKAYFYSHLCIANELLYDVYTCFTLATWRSEDFSVVPYPFFRGPLASGKSRALECLERVSYRGIMAASMSAASLFRALEAWHPTLLLDETEIYNRESMIEILALLNSGYRRGQYAIRVEKVEQGTPQLAMFDTFGFKVLAGTEELAATLQSRCIITSMSKAVRPVNLFIDEERAQELRNKLLMYRFKNLGKLEESFDVSRFAEFVSNARVIELFVCLFQVAPTGEIKNRLLECMKQITQSRLDEEQASIEARVFDVFIKCENKVKDGKIGTQVVTESFNEGLPENDQVTSRFIGRKLVALGFEKCKLSGGGLAGFFWDVRQIERLKLRYYPSAVNSTPLSPLTPLSPQNMEETASDRENTGESGDHPLETSVLDIPNNSMKSGECGDNGDSGVVPEPADSLDNFLAWLRYEYQKTSVNSIISVLPLTPIEKGTCNLCKKRDVSLVWQVQCLDGTRLDACCNDCGRSILDLASEFERKETREK